MNFSVSTLMLVAMALCTSTVSIGKEPASPSFPIQKPGPEFDVLKADVGTWDVEIKAWGGPGEPTVTRGQESSLMLGDFWLLVDFQGNMMGMDFTGHGVYSYDTEKKQYVGTWVDSMSPTKMDMVGKHDKDNKTMTYEGMAPGSDGKLAKHILTTTYRDDGTRVMTMHVQAGEEKIKIFEMSYAKTKAAKSK